MKKFILKKTNSGQVVILAVLFFTAISMIIVLGFVLPAVREVAVARNLVSGEESYFVTEAGVEDVVYRLKTGMQVSPSEVFSVGESTVTVNVADSFNGKTVTAEGNSNDYIKRIETKVVQGVGVAFNYGLQAGNGGFSMENGSGVNGNVYVNGNIEGGSGTYITGTAIAANSIALTADQTNDTPSTPTDYLIFGNANSTQDVAQSFQVGETTNLNKIELYIKKISAPANATVRIVTDASGVPSSNSLTTGTLSASSVTASYGWVTVTFSGTPQLTAGATYWLVVDGATNSTKYYTLAANTSYGVGQATIGRYGVSWNGTSPSGLDGYFRVYLGGLTSTISGVTVGTGTTGDAKAHTVTNSTIRGNLFCQIGSGNNKVCNTSEPDPTPEAFPVSEANIIQWKSDATTGGIYNGNYSVNSASASVGPTEVTGNLSVQNNATLTVNGTLWVRGNITISNNAIVRLASSYGTNSGVIVSDGVVNIGNNSQFYGSGQAGSYVLLLTTSDCPTSSSCAGARAITVENNTGTVILNAQNGSVELENNAGAKEVTAYKIELGNNAVVTYESGLADINFSSGPSGGWEITQWQEVQ